MSTPPAPFHELEDRAFSFYPPILNVDNNEWRLREATWSEIMVENTVQGLEVAVPRRYVGQVSSTDKPVMIVGLNRELEYKAGQIWPTSRKVLTIPPPVIPARPTQGRVDEEPVSTLQAMTGIGTEDTESRISRMIFVAFASLIAVVGLVWALVKFTPEAKPSFVAKDQGYLDLTRDDDYFAVVRRLGQPNEDRWRSTEGELQYRALTYKDRGFTVILMGARRDEARYIGTLNSVWRPLHSVEFASGKADTASMLRTLPKF
jgi:hypothetical protein